MNNIRIVMRDKEYPINLIFVADYVEWDVDDSGYRTGWINVVRDGEVVGSASAADAIYYTVTEINDDKEENV